MEAAITLAKRGHKPVLFEKADRLGGILHDAGSLKFKNEIREFTEYLICETNKNEIEVRLGEACTADTVKNENPDHVILATGSTYIKPNIPGIDQSHVVMARDIDNGSVEAKGNIVICGAGLTGIETAIQLGREGKQVTVVDMIPVEDFIKDKFYIIRCSILAEAEKAGVKFVGDSKVKEIRENSILVEKEGTEMEIAADTTVIALGTKSENSLYEEIYPLMPLSIIKIGDCDGVANILKAVQGGYDVAYDL